MPRSIVFAMAEQLHTRRSVLGAVAATFALGRVRAAGHGAMPKLGFMTGAGFPELEHAFSDELRQLGLLEGRHFSLQRRFTRPNTRDGIEMAAELAGSDLSLIIVSALPLALAVRDANPRMPMVIGTCPGMVSNGFANSLEHPGGIYTGIEELPPGVTARRLRLLKAAAPAVTRVALLSTTPGHGGHETQVSDAECAARELGIDVKVYRATTLAELREALGSIRRDGMNGLQTFQGALSVVNCGLIVEFAAAERMPAIYQATRFTTDGGLMSWAPIQADQMRVAARLTARILAGASPGDLPITYPPKYYLTLNAGAATRIGLEFPREFASRADKIIARSANRPVGPMADGGARRTAPT
jgi:putative tryptophan/tyrosine transport system substrate-binding protein